MLLGPAGPSWQAELRMPMIQDAIALRFARPLTDVSVAVQDLDGTGLAVENFSPDQVAAARAQFRQLGKVVASLFIAPT